MTLEELKQQEARFWVELEELEKPVRAKRSEWYSIHCQVQRVEEKEKLRQELLAELDQERLDQHGARVETEMAKNHPNTI